MGAVFQGNQPAPDDERKFFFIVKPQLIIYGLTELEMSVLEPLVREVMQA